MARSVAIIGAGQIGYAAAGTFASKGWDVSILSRSKPDWLDQKRDRFVYYTAGHDAPPQADVVVDSIAYDAEDVARYDPDRVGRLIAISSASVYCDSEGRTLDEAAQYGFPEFDGPITEDQATVAPGPETYSTRKVRMENAARDLFGDRATILRPCAIYGEHSRHPREWWFVKRILDGRTKVPLRYAGQSQFQTTCARSIGEVAQAAADQRLGGTLNVADTFAPTVIEIGRSIADSMGATISFLPIEGAAGEGVGQTPWSIPRPMVVSSEKAEDAGASCFLYSFAVDEAVDWLRDLNPADWRAAFPQLAAYPRDLFDYAAEDAFFETL